MPRDFGIGALFVSMMSSALGTLMGVAWDAMTSPRESKPREKPLPNREYQQRIEQQEREKQAKRRELEALAERERARQEYVKQQMDKKLNSLANEAIVCANVRKDMHCMSKAVWTGTQALQDNIKYRQKIKEFHSFRDAMIEKLIQSATAPDKKVPLYYPAAWIDYLKSWKRKGLPPPIFIRTSASGEEIQIEWSSLRDPSKAPHIPVDIALEHLFTVGLPLGLDYIDTLRLDAQDSTSYARALVEELKWDFPNLMKPWMVEDIKNLPTHLPPYVGQTSSDLQCNILKP